jgi:hypothetical protein
MSRVLSLPYTFVLMNWAVVAGLYYFVTGNKDVWSKTKSSHTHRRHDENRNSSDIRGVRLSAR